MTKGFLGALAAVTLLVAGCNSDRLTVPNLNNPTPGDVANDPIAGLQFSATGILRQNRVAYDQFISDVGILGRESYDYFPTDGRSHTHYVNQSPIDPSGFASGGWAPRYQNLRNVFNFLGAVESAAALTDAQKAAARGFANTQKALELHYIIAQRHNNGAVITVNEDPRELAPFVSRDAVYDYIVALLDSAHADLLAAGGEDFPFQLHAGFTTNGTFNTPDTYAQFNRAIYARVQTWRASLRHPACGSGGVTCYQAVLTALGQSFLSTSASLGLGVYHVFSTDPGDSRNILNPSVDSDLLAHPSIQTDAQLQVGGAPDARYTAKIRTFSPPRGPVGGAAFGLSTGLGFKIYATTTSPAAIIRNEELILIRAEARYFTGDVVGALTDLNFIRTTSGGLPSLAGFISDDDFITKLLYERRYSLLWEGHRWIDHRRFNRLSATYLPLDAPGHVFHTAQPVPQAECLQREQAATELKCPVQDTEP